MVGMDEELRRDMKEGRDGVAVFHGVCERDVVLWERESVVVVVLPDDTPTAGSRSDGED